MSTDLQKEVKKKPKDDAADEKSRMTFTSHLGELRTRLIHSAIALFVTFFICYAFSNYIIETLSSPLRNSGTVLETATDESEGGVVDNTSALESDEGEVAKSPLDQEEPLTNIKWVTLNPLENILVKLRFSAYGALLLSFPYIVYHICGFVFPGLKSREKRVVKLLLGGCCILAVTGALVAFKGIFPLVLPYLMKFTPDFVEPQLRLSDTLSMILKGVMGFAIAFQFPMVVLILVYMGLLTPEQLKKHRRAAIVGLFVVGAVLTPPDPISLILMALPLILLYEFSIWVSYMVVRSKKEAGA